MKEKPLGSMPGIPTAIALVLVLMASVWLLLTSLAGGSLAGQVCGVLLILPNTVPVREGVIWKKLPPLSNSSALLSA